MMQMPVGLPVSSTGAPWHTEALRCVYQCVCERVRVCQFVCQCACVHAALTLTNIVQNMPQPHPQAQERPCHAPKCFQLEPSGPITTALVWLVYGDQPIMHTHKSNSGDRFFELLFGVFERHTTGEDDGEEEQKVEERGAGTAMWSNLPGAPAARWQPPQPQGRPPSDANPSAVLLRVRMHI